ncbi:hypothetical protein [Streptomyces sp. NPDC020747]|uniref:hypothetical protein n=1 Tax=Streptomyces sp. NPDC020747 TaxID=3365086 RepID=UPI0037907775
MSGREIESSSLMPKVAVDDATWRRAAVNTAGGLAFHHPHEDDGIDPKAVGRELAHNPAIAGPLRELLGYLGYLEICVDAEKAITARLKGGQS